MIARLLLVAAALAGFAPAHAQDRPAWAGVWEGKIGAYPVMACLDSIGDGPGRGSYYYRSQLEPIALSEEEGWEGSWVERASGSDTEALWEMNDFDGKRIRGTWHRNGRTLPIALTPVAWTENEWGGPCASSAFLAPRVGGGTVSSAEAELKGWRYTAKTYRPAAYFAPEVTIDSFAFPEEQPGDGAINRMLAAYLPREAVDDDFLQCLAGSIWSLGHDGDFAEALRPVMASDAFLVAMESSSTFCGGAHPNHFYRYRTFDRQAGNEVDLFGWLADTAVERHPSGPDSDGYVTLQPALRELILAREPSDDLSTDEGVASEPYEQDCRDLALDEEFWTLGLSRGGMLFVPSMPHVAAPCAATFTVPWADLAPFLNLEGTEGVARLGER